MRYAKSPPGRPWARLSENDHRWWWYAHLHELAAVCAAAHIEEQMKHQDFTPNLNFLGRYLVRSRNDQAAMITKKAFWRYEEALKNAKIFCPWALRKHYMTTPFESAIRLVENLNPGMFDEALRSEKLSLEKKKLAALDDD